MLVCSKIVDDGAFKSVAADGYLGFLAGNLGDVESGEAIAPAEVIAHYSKAYISERNIIIESDCLKICASLPCGEYAAAGSIAEGLESLPVSAVLRVGNTGIVVSVIDLQSGDKMLFLKVDGENLPVC